MLTIMRSVEESMGIRVQSIGYQETRRVFGAGKARGRKCYRFEIALADPMPEARAGDLSEHPHRHGTRDADFGIHRSASPAAFLLGLRRERVLGEVTFVAEHGGKLTGLIVEKEGGCSLFANVDRSIVSGDFTQLGPEVMLSGVALSLTDTILWTPATRPGGRRRRVARTRRAPRADDRRSRVVNAPRRRRPCAGGELSAPRSVPEKVQTRQLTVIGIPTPHVPPDKPRFLGHEYETDVFAFPSARGTLEGEMYVNLDRAQRRPGSTVSPRDTKWPGW